MNRFQAEWALLVLVSELYSDWVVETPNSRVDLNPAVMQAMTGIWTLFLKGTTVILQWELLRSYHDVSDNTFPCCLVRTSISARPASQLSPLGDLFLRELHLNTAMMYFKRSEDHAHWLHMPLLTSSDIPTDQMTTSSVQLNLPSCLNPWMFSLLLCHSKDIHLTATTSINGC